MGLVELKCKSCGAVLQKSDDRDVFYCEYCGSKMTFDKVKHEISGTVKIDGIAGADDLLDRASIMLRNGQYDEASKMFDRVLEVKPRCAEAYWGKLLCYFRENNPNAFIEKAVDITKCFHYDNAVKFAQGATRDYYIEIGEKSKAARNKFISKNKKRKNISRIIFYTFYSIETLMLIFLCSNEGWFKTLDMSNKSVIEMTASIEKAEVITFTISNFIALVSNRILTRAKSLLGIYSADKLKYLLFLALVASIPISFLM